MSAKKLFNLEWRMKPEAVKSHTLDSDAAWSVIVARKKKRKGRKDVIPTVRLSEPVADRVLATWARKPNAHLFEFRKVEVLR